MSEVRERLWPGQCQIYTMCGGRPCQRAEKETLSSSVARVMPLSALYHGAGTASELPCA